MEESIQIVHRPRVVSVESSASFFCKCYNIFLDKGNFHDGLCYIESFAQLFASWFMLYCIILSGVFMMVAFGIIAGVFIISIEIAYKRHRRLKEKELELAKTAADRWRGNIEVFTFCSLFACSVT